MADVIDLLGEPALRKRLEGFERQIPFAIATGLNKTAEDVQREEKAELPKRFDRPTPFTERAFGVRRASKSRQHAAVFIKDRQADYLRLQIEGGVRSLQRGAVPVPFGVRLNRYGNMPRKLVQRLLQRPDVFVGTIRGIRGIWQRGTHSGNRRFTTEFKSFRGPRRQTGFRLQQSNARNVHLLVALEPQVQYEKRFPFFDIAEATVRQRLRKNFADAVEHAIATAR